MEARPLVGYMNAGGRGTRLEGLFPASSKTGIAKALLEIGNPKIKLVDHHIENLRSQNVKEIVIAAGDQSEVYEYVSDMYARESDVVVTRSFQQIGTGGDLVTYARQREINDLFIVQNVDTILDINIELFRNQFMRKRSLGAVACIALTLNSDVPNEGAYLVAEHDKISSSAEFNDEDEAITHSGAVQYRASSTGAVVIDSGFLRSQHWLQKDGMLSLYRQTLRQAWQNDALYSYNNGHNFFRDIGTTAMWLNSQRDETLDSLLCYNNR